MQRMNLAIDSGNSATKIGLFHHRTLMEKSTFQELEGLRNYMQGLNIKNVIISSVKANTAMISSWAQEAEEILILKKDLPLPLNNLYATPDTLGMDRLAAVCGAQALFPDRNCLVIDAGTCITYDFIDNAANYHGGSISPGLNMRFQAVHTFTAKLPLVTPRPGAELIGHSTESSIQSGVVNGLLAEIEGIIRQYQEKFADLRVILCGGDGGFFENQLKASIFASPELVLIGLNSILIHNVDLK